MRRPRETLFKATVIVLAIAAGIALLHTYDAYRLRYSMQTFVDAYAGADISGRERIADDYLKTHEPADLLAAVERSYAGGVCHVQAHPLGRAVYKKYSNFSESVRQCGGTCTYGCFHGVLLEMFDTDSDTLGGTIVEEESDAFIGQVKALALDLCTKPDVAAVVRLRTCYHGLGHVFGYLHNNEIGPAIKDCEIFSNTHARQACVTGVFMENLFSASSTAALETRDESPCDKYPQYRSECHIYKAYGWLVAWGNDIDAAFTACDTFGPQRRSCIVHTAQAAATMPLLETQEGFDSICGGFSGDDRDACFEGALVKVIDLNNGDDSIHACDRVTIMYYSACLDVLKKFHKNFNG